MKHSEPKLTESQLKDGTQDGGNLFFTLNKLAFYLVKVTQLGV
jgi:hypothetical protein